ncbi:MAG: hypothetical protein E7599_02790 [Ruminococcaceae bacterium]|nr:hypothetical protein [Oscillospiraceae bacterium]
MTKFQKIQKWSSIIPFHSTIFVAVVTYVTLAKYKAKIEYWVKFVLYSVIAVCGTYLIYNCMLADTSTLIQIAVCGLILYFVNCYYIEMQIACQKDRTKRHSEPSKKQPQYDKRSRWDRLPIADKIDTFVIKHYKSIIITWAILFLVFLFSYIIYVAAMG